VNFVPLETIQSKKEETVFFRTKMPQPNQGIETVHAEN
jgi:hypothetical protein